MSRKELPPFKFESMGYSVESDENSKATEITVRVHGRRGDTPVIIDIVVSEDRVIIDGSAFAEHLGGTQTYFSAVTKL